jgi:hypothetical protein
MELNKIFNDMEKCERGCSEYYKVIDFIQRLNEIENITIEEDVVLTPFYILPNSTYELYDYAVYFLNVKQSQKEEYILKKTGRKSLKEIDSEIVDKLGMCYIEIVNGDILEVMVKFKKYLTHLLNSPKVEERIPEVLRPFDRRQLYFEVIKL